MVAFVTFQTEVAQLEVLRNYPDDWFSRRCRCCQKAKLRLEDGLHKVRVDEAPEPSDVIWENLATSSFGRAWRSLVTTLLVFIALFISALPPRGAASQPPRGC